MSRKKSNVPKNNTLITNFFSKPQESYVPIQDPTEVAKDINHIDDFYIMAVDGCQSKVCNDKKLSLQQRLASAKSKLEQIKKAQAVAMSICTEKDEHVSILLRKLDLVGTDTKSDGASSAQTLPFSKFEHVFEEGDLKRIRSLGNSVPEDSTFVLQVTKSLYASNLDQLRHKSVTGRSKDNSKEAITPEKMNLLKSMYIERMGRLPGSESRLGHLNQLTNRAILNINNAKKNKKDREDMLSNINEQFKNDERLNEN